MGCIAAIPNPSEIAGSDGSDGGDPARPSTPSERGVAWSPEFLLGLLAVFLGFKSGLNGNLLDFENFVVQAIRSSKRRTWATDWASSTYSSKLNDGNVVN